MMNNQTQNDVSMQTFSTQFTLTRDYLAECFDESLPHGKNAKPNYLFPACLFAAGSGLLYLTDQPQFAGWTLVALAVLELFHIRYSRAWWLARQMWGASANSEVTLTIDETGIQTHSPFSQTEVLWPDIKRVIKTELGYIMVDKASAQQYLSKSLMPDGLIEELVALHKI